MGGLSWIAVAYGMGAPFVHGCDTWILGREVYDAATHSLQLRLG